MRLFNNSVVFHESMHFQRRIEERDLSKFCWMMREVTRGVLGT